MAKVSRGTTPTFTFIAPDGLDMTLPLKIWVTFSTMDEKEILTKTSDDLEVETDRVEVYLTQEETLGLADNTKVQLNWVYTDDETEKRSASNKMVIETESNLERVVLNAD